MKTWPMDLDEHAVFKDAFIESITIAEYSIYLNFGNGLLLTVLTPFRYQEKALREDLSFPLGISSIAKLIGKKVVSVKLCDRRDLLLAFEGGYSLEIFASNVGYDCYSIKLNHREFYIVG